MSRLDGISKPVDPRKLRLCSIGSWLPSLDPAELAQLEEWLDDSDVPMTKLAEVSQEHLGLTVGYESMGHHVRGRCACPEGTALQRGQ